MSWIALLLVPGAVCAEIDFSTCGYKQSESAIPNVPAIIVVSPAGGVMGRESNRRLTMSVVWRWIRRGSVGASFSRQGRLRLAGN